MDVWQKSMELVKHAYHIAGQLPASEQYGLGSQIRRASVSIPSNIAEGSGRGTKRDYARFVGNSKGSLCELETLFEVAAMLGFTSVEDDTKQLCERVSKMLTRLRQSLLD